MGLMGRRAAGAVATDIRAWVPEGSLAGKFRVGFRPIFGQTWPQNPSRTTVLVLQCLLQHKSARQTNSKALSWHQKIPARLPSGTQIISTLSFRLPEFTCKKRAPSVEAHMRTGDGKGSRYVPNVSTHFLFFCRMMADPGLVRNGSGTSFLGPRGRFRAPGRGF